MTVFGITYRRWVNGQFDPLDQTANIGAQNDEMAAQTLRGSLMQHIEISRIVSIAVVHFIQAA